MNPYFRETFIYQHTCGIVDAVAEKMQAAVIGMLVAVAAIKGAFCFDGESHFASERHLSHASRRSADGRRLWRHHV